MSKATKIFGEICQKHGADINAPKVRSIFVIEMIEKALEAPDSRAIPYQVCPICKGEGKLFSDINKTTALMEQCDTCGGTKVIPMYMPPKEEKCRMFQSVDTSGFCDNCGKPQHEHDI